MEASLFVIIFGVCLCNLLGFTPNIITYYARTINCYFEISSKIMFDFTNYRDLDAFYMIDYIGFNGGGSDTSRVPHGEPYAGKLHVRFDEGADVPCGGVSPYSTPS